MLRLKQIEIVGFKSFANRERLRFPGTGIAAVVGPNGCGKSNICDSINWVLGEQSAKSLRGSRMHDVIFAGTRNRAPAGMATVTLTLLDADRSLERRAANGQQGFVANLPPSKKRGEIAVTRKLFSNGQSQYILNGKVVRLRDVQDLFLGTGLGPNHYAIIEQGRIGQLLSARPVDRRAFVEEAAGVTRFKARRRLAELKLANASLNLERVHDILQEVQRQSNSLKRQAERAERYERYREQLRAAQRTVFGSRFRRIEFERTRLETEVQAAQARLADITQSTVAMETEFAASRELEQQQAKQLEAQREELSGLRIDEERMRERREHQAGTISDNAARQRQASEELEVIAQRVKALEEGLDGERSGVAQLAQAVSDLRQSLEQKELECAVQGATVAEVQAAQQACRNRLIETLNAISHARGHLGKLDETLASYDRQLEDVRKRATRVSQETEQAVARQAECAERAGGLAAQVRDQAAQMDGLRDAVAISISALESSRKAVEECRAEVSRLRARRDSLQQMLDHRAYTTDAVKDIFEALEKSASPSFRPLGILADFLEVHGGRENAVEQFLGEDLEMVVVGDWEQAGSGAQLVREELGGRAAFIVQSGAPAAPVATANGLDEAESVMDYVRFVGREGQPAPAPLRKLRDGYFVPDAPVAEGLARLHPELYFLLPNGDWYSGHTVQAGRKVSSGPLVLKQQVRDLAPQLEAAEKDLGRFEQGLERAEEAVRRETEQLEAARGRLQELEKAALAADHDQRQAERVVEELQRTSAEASAESERLGSEREKCASRRAQVLEQRTKLESVYAESESRSAELETKGRDAQALLDRLHEERTALRTEAATLDERERAAQASLRRMEAQLGELRDRHQLVEQHIEQWRNESERLRAENEQLATRIGEAAERQAKLRDKIDETAAMLQEARTQTEALISAVRDRRAHVESARQACSAKEVELARLQADRDHLAADCESELRESIAGVAASAPPEIAPEALRDAEEAYQSIKGKIERLGPVNILARQEYEEVSRRRDFLESQQRDLVDSIANAREAIKEIDLASREKFDAAFEGINEHFRGVFATLFKGGLGEMRLTDPENREESGIEIVAQPPGKRLQNVALLSGGEKSLTVMALLMATFRYQPSPFCVLDEVDSQLDEANTVRLRRLLQAMAPETQFVVITHSKSTMEVAETLYGVTMGEAGVSKLVSVSMAESRPVARPLKSPETAPLALGA